MDKVKKSFGLPTGIAMVIGIVIGSGVFLKAGRVLQDTDGNLALSLAAWLTGGLIMVVSGFCFAVFANKVEKFNGVIDYVEHSTNRRVAYHLAWLFNTLYYPVVCSVVSMFASIYFIKLTNIDFLIDPKGIADIYVLLTKWPTYIIALVFIITFYLVNYFAPSLSAKFQVSSTVIKLVPIILIVFIGLFASLINKDNGIISAFTKPSGQIDGYTITNNFGSAVKRTAFAYEGWVCATSINAELKDSKRNLPKALVIGTVAVIIFYLLYFIGVSAVLGNKQTIIEGANAPIAIFKLLMGTAGEKIFTIFILISCLGTVNGVAAANSRGLYTMSVRGLGPWVDKACKLDKKSGMSKISCLWGFITTIFCYVLWILAFQDIPYFKHLNSMDEIVCSIIYACYILMFIYMIRNFKDMGIIKRFVMPILAICGCIFFILCGTGLFQLMAGQGTEDLINFGIWLSLFVIVEIPSLFFYREEKN